MLEESNFRFFYLGNLIPSKGCLLLLDACEILARKGYIFSCDVVGGETAEITAVGYLAEIQNRNLLDRVFYHGKRYGAEKEDFFRQANVFVFPTYYKCECFPVVLLEAMQHRLPVISTYEGAIPDMVIEGKTGYLVLQRDLNSLVERMEFLLLNPALGAQMGLEGEAYFKAHFTKRIFEERMKMILTGL